ncbi:ATP-binding protein [Peterkaempfera bronchialis]|uniref:ATP-binding protein n=1 Tax=Peterkaempfera bronchialis TaxID=2126346 RepID=UPI003C2DEF73
MPAHHTRFLLARRPALVSVARARVCAQVRTWGAVLDPDTWSTLELLVSELVTNAVVHAEGLLIAVGVRLERGRLRIEVDDDSARPPIEAPTGPENAQEDESGRGLQLTAALAEEHGWEPTPRGKQVWFELALPEPPGASAGAALQASPTTPYRRDPRPWSPAADVRRPTSRTKGRER